jgi:beta-lactamase superfamily II metal-dependent hydrolase
VSNSTKLKISSLGVGHGDATLITFIHPDGRWNCLIDGGECPATLSKVLADAWLDHGNQHRELDLLVTSHFDSDHLDGLRGITKRFAVREYYAPALPAFHRHSWLFGTKCQAAFASAEMLENEVSNQHQPDGQAHPSRIIYPLEGFSSVPFQDGSLRIEILSPARRFLQRLLISDDISDLIGAIQTPLGWLISSDTEDDDEQGRDQVAMRSLLQQQSFLEPGSIPPSLWNKLPSGRLDTSAAATEMAVEPEFFGDNLLNNSSLVVLLEARLGLRTRRALFPGDQENWTHLFAQHERGLLIDVLKAPHHGGRVYMEATECQDDFFRFLQPSGVLFSGSGRYGLPRSLTRAAAAQWGCSVLCTNSRGVEVVHGVAPQDSCCHQGFQCTGDGKQTVSLAFEQDIITARPAACHTGNHLLHRTSPISISHQTINQTSVLGHLAEAELRKHLAWITTRLKAAHNERKHRDNLNSPGAKPFTADVIEGWARKDNRAVVVAQLDSILNVGARRGIIWAKRQGGYRSETWFVYTCPSAEDYQEFESFLNKPDWLLYQGTLARRNLDADTILCSLEHSNAMHFVECTLGFPPETFDVLFRPRLFQHLQKERHLFWAEDFFVFTRLDAAKEADLLASCACTVRVERHFQEPEMDQDFAASRRIQNLIRRFYEALPLPTDPELIVRFSIPSSSASDPAPPRHLDIFGGAANSSLHALATAIERHLSKSEVVREALFKQMAARVDPNAVAEAIDNCQELRRRYHAQGRTTKQRLEEKLFAATVDKHYGWEARFWAKKLALDNAPDQRAYLEQRFRARTVAQQLRSGLTLEPAVLREALFEWRRTATAVW